MTRHSTRLERLIGADEQPDIAEKGGKQDGVSRAQTGRPTPGLSTPCGSDIGNTWKYRDDSGRGASVLVAKAQELRSFRPTAPFVDALCSVGSVPLGLHWCGPDSARPSRDSGTGGRTHPDGLQVGEAVRAVFAPANQVKKT